MAAQVLPASGTAGGSFLDSPVFNSRRAKAPPSGFDLQEASNHKMGYKLITNNKTTDTANNNVNPIQTLDFDSSDLNDSVCRTYLFDNQHIDTPDSGCSGLATSTPALKTPESDMSGSATPCGSSGGSTSGHRKRKTVTIDESQTSIVVISPDDLFNTYSKAQSRMDEEDGETEEYELEQPAPITEQPVGYGLTYFEDGDHSGHSRYVRDTFTGWPLKRSDSLESRDNPFLPGGDLSREAEDLLSRATIIRDHFYLNEEEKKTLREQQLLQQQQEQNQQQPPQKQPRAAKHVQIVDHHDGVNGHATSAVEERIAPQTVSSTSAAPPSGDGQQSPKENGKASDSATGASSTPTGPDSVHVTIPDGDGQPHNTSTTGGGPNSAAALGDLQVQDADKKRRNKCCAVM